MSAKSRKRNRALLALAGIITTGTLANRKPKQSSTEENSGKGGDGPAAIARRNANKTTTAKKDTATKTSTTIQDNKNKDRTKSMAETSTVPKKRPGITVYDDGSIKAKDKGSGNQVDYANKEKYSTRKDTKAPGASGSTTSSGNTATGSSTFNDKIKANNDRIKSGLRSGGRAGYKSGGSTGSSKSSGCAIKGISPILMKGRK
jgi:hypothetical protein